MFAKATVKLISGSLSHENQGNQFGHAAPIFQIMLLATTAVLQIICLNRGLKVYDSTLVVPVFYGVYTAAGFLDSLIFNNEVDSYKSWTLFLIFVSIIVLISGVVLLTHKKPERTTPAPGVRLGLAARKTKHKAKQSDAKALVDRQEDGDDEGQSLRRSEEGNVEDAEELWAVGEVSDDEDEPTSTTRLQRTPTTAGGEEGVELMIGDHGEEDAHELGHGRPRAESTLSRRLSDPFRDELDRFGELANGHAGATER